MADQLLDLLRKFDPTLTLKYNKFYIGLAKMANHSTLFHSSLRKTTFFFNFKLPQTDELDRKIDEAGLDILCIQKE